MCVPSRKPECRLCSILRAGTPQAGLKRTSSKQEITWPHWQRSTDRFDRRWNLPAFRRPGVFRFNDGNARGLRCPKPKSLSDVVGCHEVSKVPDDVREVLPGLPGLGCLERGNTSQAETIAFGLW